MVGKRFNRRKRTRREAVGEAVGKVAGLTQRVVPWLLLLTAVVSLPVLLVWGWQHGVQSSYFHLEAPTIEGNARVSVEEIHEAIGYEGPGTNIFGIDVEEARRRLEREVPWVLEARVDKTLPNKIEVAIKERSLGGIALVGELMLVDTQGVPFKPLEREQGMDMAVVTGLGDSVEALGPEDYDRIAEALNIIVLYDNVGAAAFDRLAEVHIDRVTGFTLITEREGIKVLMGEGVMERRLKRLKE